MSKPEPKEQDWGQAYESLGQALTRLTIAGHDVMRCNRGLQYETFGGVNALQGSDEARDAEKKVREAIEAVKAARYAIGMSYEQVFYAGPAILRAGTHVVAEESA